MTWICRVCDPKGTVFLEGGQDELYAHYNREHLDKDLAPKAAS